MFGDVSPPAASAAGRDARAAVVDALLGLLNEGRSDPSLTDVAARVGMSVDAVLQAFDGLDDLRHELVALHLDRVRALLATANLRGGPVEPRVRQFVDVRLQFCATMAGTGRVAHTRSQVPEIAGAVHSVRALWHAHACSQFEPELSRLEPAQADERVATIDGLFLFDAWDELATVQGRSAEDIRRAWTRTLLAVLAPTS